LPIPIIIVSLVELEGSGWTSHILSTFLVKQMEGLAGAVDDVGKTRLDAHHRHLHRSHASSNFRISEFDRGQVFRPASNPPRWAYFSPSARVGASQ